jgi:hypothetical protein
MAFPGFKNQVVCADCGTGVKQTDKGEWTHAGRSDHALLKVEMSHDQKNRVNKARGFLQDADGDYSIPKASSKAPTRKVISSKEAVAAGKKNAAAAKKPKKKAAPYVKRAPKLTERTGVLTFPAAPAVERKRGDSAGEILQPAQEKSTEKLAPGWKSYITPEGTHTTDWNESVEAQRMPKSDRDVRAKGAKHLEKDHPWVKTNDPLDPSSPDVEGAVFTGLPAASVTASSTGKQTIWYSRLKQMATDLAHWHKKQFDPGDEYEYQVHQARPINSSLVLSQKEINQVSPYIVRRRARYCEKCAPTEPVMIGKSKHWYGPAQTMFKSMTGRLKANPKQAFVRPEPTELDPPTRMQDNGKGTPIRDSRYASTPVLNQLDNLMTQAENTRANAFAEGRGGDFLAKPTPTDIVKSNTRARGK